MNILFLNKYLEAEQALEQIFEKVVMPKALWTLSINSLLL